MLAKLICGKCGADLTSPIRIHSSKDPSFDVPEIEDGKPLTVSGEAIKSWEPMQRSLDPNEPTALEFVPQYWLNPTDTEASVKPVNNPRRLNGCCGLAGCDGPNMRCNACKAEVGTRRSDCWTANVFIPDPNNTQWLEVVQ